MGDKSRGLRTHHPKENPNKEGLRRDDQTICEIVRKGVCFTDWFQKKTLVQSGNMDLFDFGDIDFSRFTFNTLDTPQVVALNKKIKKFIVIQLILENDEIGEGFGVYGIQVQYAIGNYVK